MRLNRFKITTNIAYCLPVINVSAIQKIKIERIPPSPRDVWKALDVNTYKYIHTYQKSDYFTNHHLGEYIILKFGKKNGMSLLLG